MVRVMQERRERDLAQQPKLLEACAKVRAGGPRLWRQRLEGAARDLALKERLASPDVPSDDHTA